MNYNTLVHKTYSRPVELSPVKLYHVTLHDKQIFNLSAMRDGIVRIGGTVEYLGAFKWAILTRKGVSEIDAQLRIFGANSFQIEEMEAQNV